MSSASRALNPYAGSSLRMPYQRSARSDAMLGFSESVSRGSSRSFGKNGFSGYKGGSKQRPYKRIKYAAPTPKCYLNSSTQTFNSVTPTKFTARFMNLAIGSYDNRRTGYTTSGARLNVNFTIKRAYTTTLKSYLLRMTVFLCTKSDCLTADQIFAYPTGAAQWNCPVAPLALTAGYVTLHDDIFHVDCVPSQIYALPHAWSTSWSYLPLTRTSSVSFDLRNMVQTYTSAPNQEPVTNSIVIYVQTSESISGSSISIDTRSAYYFYDF